MENSIALPELAYDVLRLLVNGSIDHAELLNHFLGKLNDASKTLATLGKLGYVSGAYRRDQAPGQVKLEPLGHTALILHDEQKASLEQQLKEREKQLELAQAQVTALEDVADTLRKDLALAQAQAERAEVEAKIAREDAQKAARRSVVSIVIAAVSAFATILAWLFPR